VTYKHKQYVVTIETLNGELKTERGLDWFRAAPCPRRGAWRCGVY